MFAEMDFQMHSGLYLGLSGYAKIAPNLYLGGEIGYFNESETEKDAELIAGEWYDAENELTYIPIEINLKYLIDDFTPPGLTIGFGGGLSLNYAEFERNMVNGDTITWDQDEWLFGAQLFTEVNQTFGDHFFFGANGKLQATEKFVVADSDNDLYFDMNFSNWRLGAHVGLKF